MSIILYFVVAWYKTPFVHLRLSFVVSKIDNFVSKALFIRVLSSELCEPKTAIVANEEEEEEEENYFIRFKTIRIKLAS